MKQPLIAPKTLTEYEASEFHAYVAGMYALRQKGRAKAAAVVPGISVTRSKKGKLGLRRSKERAFAYITYPEITALAKHHSLMQSELWNLFKQKDFIITQTRMKAEQLYAELNSLPWGGTNG